MHFWGPFLDIGFGELGRLHGFGGAEGEGRVEGVGETMYRFKNFQGFLNGVF